MDQKENTAGATGQGTSDLDMLMGITKHIAGLSDKKGRKQSTTLMVAQETLKEKIVKCSNDTKCVK